MRAFLSGRRSKRPTKADGARFMDQAFEDRISWVAARILLVRTLNDPLSNALAPELLEAIARFLARHPAPAIGEAARGELAVVDEPTDWDSTKAPRP